MSRMNSSEPTTDVDASTFADFINSIYGQMLTGVAGSSGATGPGGAVASSSAAASSSAVEDSGAGPSRIGALRDR